MSATLAAPAVQYRVQSDLNRESLPQSNRDPQRKVWWMNAICASVLAIGFLLTKEPAEYAFQPVVVEPPMQVEVFTPEPTPQQPEEQTEEVIEEVEVAVIQPTVVAADPSKVAFAVEVKGPTVTSGDLRKVSPPPAIQQRPKAAAPSGPILFSASNDGGFYPDPEYPFESRRRGEQGSVKILVTVAEDGSVVEAKVLEPSGFANLDRATLSAIKRFWRWPPGKAAQYIVPKEFKLVDK